MLGLFDCDYDLVFFFKQKTAYEMRISDWSSDVCSSDLSTRPEAGRRSRRRAWRWGRWAETLCVLHLSLRGYRILARRLRCPVGEKIGRASCRERVCQYV